MKKYVRYYYEGKYIDHIVHREIETESVDDIINDIQSIDGIWPYRFQFVTRHPEKETSGEWSISNVSHMYFVNGKIRTLDELIKENNPNNKVLIGNMKSNNYDKIIESTHGWVSSFREGKDTLIEVKMREPF